MIYSSNLIAVLDACVLNPAPVRDFFLTLADIGLYKPKWTVEIQEEWSRNLLLNRPDLNKDQLQLTIDAMNTAFPDPMSTSMNLSFRSFHFQILMIDMLLRQQSDQKQT